MFNVPPFQRQRLSSSHLSPSVAFGAGYKGRPLGVFLFEGKISALEVTATVTVEKGPGFLVLETGWRCWARAFGRWSDVLGGLAAGMV